MIIDTHCHLDDERYRDDLEEVIRRAKSHGVAGMLIPGADPADLPRAREIAYTHENIFFAAGVHPYHAKDYDEALLLRYAEDPKCIAIGECGLDYYRLPEEESQKREEKERQKEIFRAQIRLAKNVKKPLIIHIREASADSRELLINEQAKEVGGVLHCFNASPILLDLADHGFYFGIGGVLTFKNAKKLVEILPKIPKDRLLLETDAPYLTPHPHRGKRNEPWYTTFIAQKMAEVLGMELSELEEVILKNTVRLFPAFKSISGDERGKTD
ncbi:MAG: hydrolase TatD [Campylobacteraceae bacterium 4484_4]|nr:MAG: hydrolase TatD [Campylobacteraceae bacterium 4484_4]